MKIKIGHNPYFNRWFSAICSSALLCPSALKVTILILIDGFLQSHGIPFVEIFNKVTILILIDGFLQYIRRLSGVY